MLRIITLTLLLAALLAPPLRSQEMLDSTVKSELIARARERFALHTRLTRRGLAFEVRSARLDSLQTALLQSAPSGEKTLPEPTIFTLKLRNKEFRATRIVGTFPSGSGRDSAIAAGEQLKDYMQIVFNCIFTLDTVAFPEAGDRCRVFSTADGYTVRFNIDGRREAPEVETWLAKDLRVTAIVIHPERDASVRIEPRYMETKNGLVIDTLRVDLAKGKKGGFLMIQIASNESHGLILPATVRIKGEDLMMFIDNSPAHDTVDDTLTVGNYTFKEN